MKKILPISISLICFLVFTFQLNAQDNQRPFITKWKTNIITESENHITIPTNPDYEYLYDVDWNGDGSFEDTNVEGDIKHIYDAPGEYTVVIKGTFPAIYFNSNIDYPKIIEIVQWGDIQWETMERAFASCMNLEVTATDAPNLSNVTSLEKMFYGAATFNSSINHWNIDNITNLNSTFEGASKFNQDLNNWNVGNVTSMSFTFSAASAFNGDISNWDLTSVTTIDHILENAESFNGDISNWDVSNITNMKKALYGTKSFTGDVSDWDVSNVTNMIATFARAYIWNGDISDWNVSNVTNMAYMFWYTHKFKGDISDWNVSNVTSTEGMFGSVEEFNCDLNKWDVSNITNMSFMFANAYAFNHDLNSWNVSKVTNFESLFYGAKSFNGKINNWDVSNGTSMSQMFWYAEAFNQNISDWDVSNITDMSEMFSGATAWKGDVSDWNVSKVNNMTRMFNGISLETTIYNKLLSNWSKLELQRNVTFDAGSSIYSGKDAEIGKNILIEDFLWTITDGGIVSNINSITDFDLKIYPNPTTDIINININNSNLIDGTIKLYDPNGKQVLQKIITSKNEKINKDLYSGSYNVVLEKDNIKITKKLLVY
ncbi:MAG: BspA family leucine-rich repeat surface protein [Hyphomicrobiales bacterium]